MCPRRKLKLEQRERTESGEPKAESRKQRTESREQKTENRVPETASSSLMRPDMSITRNDERNVFSHRQFYSPVSALMSL